MIISDALVDYRKESGMTQNELAKKLNVDRTLISKIEQRKRPWQEQNDSNLTKVSWKLALIVADERTDGYISNILEDVPNMDLHPAALKDLLLKDFGEAEKALGELILARHIDPEKRKQSAEIVWHEITDVMEKAAILRGVLEEEFGLERKRLIKKHEMEVRQGER